jgi:acetyl-CoA C-acetyltransferase
MSELNEAVIISAARTPVGKFLGSLKGFSAPQLGAIAVRESVKRAGVKPEDVDEVIMGCVIQAGLGQNPARQAALNGGLPNTVSAVTVNKVCGSGLKAVMMAAQGVRLGDVDVVVAGGMESMSNAPYLIPKAREGYRLGNGELVDSMINDGLWCAFENYHMGCTGEVVAEEYRIGRSEQDEFATNSHRKAAAAIKAGKFNDEIVAVEIPQ